MSPTLLYDLVVVLKAIAEIAGLALLGQGVLLLMAGPHRDRNVFYAILSAMTAPIRALTRCVVPRFVVDRHIGLAAFGLVLLLWFLLYVAKVYLVLRVASDQLPS